MLWILGRSMSYEEKDGRGQAAYDPTMMVRVLLYGYCVGSYSSRKIQAKTYEHIAFRYLAATIIPTIALWQSFANGI